MALIKCPECGKKISDKSKLCVHCGYPIDESVRHTAPSMTDKPSPNVSRHSKPPKKKYRNALLIVASLLLAIIVVLGIRSIIYNKAMHQKDLSSVFDFSFTMNMESIIEYEKSVYGNTEYNYNHENNRLDFEFDNDGQQHHLYFFDTATGELESLFYDECEHVKPIRDKLLELVGNWDKKTYDGLFRYIYGQVDGVGIQVKYENGAFNAVSIRRSDKK